MPFTRTTIPPHAFARISIDFAGPITQGNAKFHILVVRCMNSGAIFLRLLENQKADSVLCVLQELSSIYGKPEYIYSDNGTGFIKCASWIRKLCSDLQNSNSFQWVFSTPYSPQSNGITERMVGIVKRSLKNYSLKKSLTIMQIKAFLAELTTMLNSRPLYSNDREIITPYHLILARSINIIPTLNKDSTKESNELIDFRILRKKLNVLWTDWHQNYFISLRDLPQNHMKLTTFKLGDQVLCEQITGSDRTTWPIGTITKLYPDVDGINRKVEININGRNFLRPVHRLILIPARGGCSI